MSYRGQFSSGKGKKSGGTGKIVLAVVLTIVIMLLLELGLAWWCYSGFKSQSGPVWWFISSKIDKVTQAAYEEKDTSGEDLSSLIGNLDETAPSESPSGETEAAAQETEDPTEAATEPDYGETGKVINIVVIGQDSREGEEHKLADCIMLLTFNKETRTVVMTSFLRDSYVKLADYREPGGTQHTCGWNRINTSYALGYAWCGDAGAMDMLNQTLNGNYGVTVDGNVEFNFDTFMDIINTLGGVEIDITEAEYEEMLTAQDNWNKWIDEVGLDEPYVDIHVGTNTLNGYMALDYARTRHAGAADSDMNRVKRQQKVLTQVVNKLAKMDLAELNDLINMVLGEIITNISAEDIQTYVTELLPYLLEGNLTFVSNQCPAEGTYYGEIKELPDGPSGVLVVWDFNKNKEILAEVQAGGLPESAEEAATEPAA